MKKILLLSLTLFVLGFGCSKEPPPKTPEQIEMDEYSIQPNDLIISSAQSGQTIRVDQTKFAKPGFLAVIENTEGDDTILGYSTIVPSGERQNQKIALTILLEEGKTYTVRMYDDTDGDTEFKLIEDKPLYKAGTDQFAEKTFIATSAEQE